MVGRSLRWLALVSVSIPNCAAEAGEPASQRFRYDGTFGWFSEEPEGGETCTFKQPDWQTSGYLRLERSAARGLKVYEEAWGCTIEASAADEESETFGANAVSCTWGGGVSVREMGVVERTFDSWQYDSRTGTLMASGRSVRKTAAGQRLVSCFSLDLTLTLVD
jgi:hypothetical protein